MKHILFPKPPPIEPLEERRWLMQPDRSEVGRQPFFHGRDEEYGIFRATAQSLSYGDIGGGTLIFQGAPGAGKSALMLECMEAVRRHSTPQKPWVAVSVAPADLNSPADVMTSLIDAADEEIKRLSMLTPETDFLKLKHLVNFGERMYKQLSERGFSLAGVSIGGKTRPDKDLEVSPATLFRRAAELLDNINFIMFVDEAQNAPVEPMTKAVLDCLHRDPQGLFLVAIFFGLNDTVDVLQKCGLSRLALDRVVNLEPLSLEDATGSFRRMFDMYYSGSDEEKRQWSTTLAELSQGWPQHVNRIGVAAGHVIRANDGKMERHLLEQALEKGTQKKNDYYDQRIAAGYREADLYVELAVAAGRNPNGLLSLKELQICSEQELQRSGISFDDFLLQSLHAGLLAPAKGTLARYKFPIPSLGDYLRSQLVT